MTTARRMTADHLWAYPGRDRAELVRGVLSVSEPPGAVHGQLAARLAARLLDHVEGQELGSVLVETGCIVRRDPDTVRGPDVSFVSTGRLAPNRIPARFLPFAPDLAVEIASPEDRPGALADKVRDYLEGGTRLVWLVRPTDRTVTVHRADGSTRRLADGDGLDGEDVVPGFHCPLGAVLPREA